MVSYFLLSSAATDIPLHIKQPDTNVKFYNVLMWSVILGLKFIFGLFILITPLTRLGHGIADEVRKSENDDVIEFATVDIPFRDMKGLRVLVPLWIIVFLLYVVDFEAWYVVISSLSSSIIAIQRRVHEKSGTDINHETVRYVASAWGAFSEKQAQDTNLQNDLGTQVHCDDGSLSGGEQKGVELTAVHLEIYEENKSENQVFDSRKYGNVDSLSQRKDSEVNEDQPSETDGLEYKPRRKVSNRPPSSKPIAYSSVDRMPFISLGDSDLKWNEALNKTTLHTLSFALQWNDIVASMREEDIISDSLCDTLEFVLDSVKCGNHEKTKLNDLIIMFPAFFAKGGVGNIISTLSNACAQTKDYTRLVQTSRGGEQRRGSITSAHSPGSGSPRQTLKSPSFSAVNSENLSIVGYKS